MAIRRSQTVLKLLGATALGGSFAFAMPASAQEAAAKNDSNEIVVTATRRSQDV
jgi:outer membrane cobalamin receptor